MAIQAAHPCAGCPLWEEGECDGDVPLQGCEALLAAHHHTEQREAGRDQMEQHGHHFIEPR